MSNEITNYIKEFKEFCTKSGFDEDTFLSLRNLDRYIDTVVDGFEGYPVWVETFKGDYKPRILKRMLELDFKSRIHNLIGLSTDDYRSVILLEPPMTEKPGKLRYFLSADIHTFSVFLHPSTYRQDDFENYALRTRTPFIDEKTWYLYIFTTQKKYQRQGYGKKLIGSIISFAKEKGYSLCLETDLDENVPMYENFGFRVMDSSIYNNSLHHYVMVRKPGDKREEERFDK